jgi:hypothetical protein
MPIQAAGNEFLFLGLKLNEWAAILFGATGFAISLVTLLRSITTAKRTRTIELNQRRHEVLALAVEADTALMIAKRQLQELRYEAHSDGAADIQKQAEEFIENLNKQTELVQHARNLLGMGIPTTRREAMKLEPVLDQCLIQLRPFADEKRIEEEGRVFIDPARENLRLRRLLKAQGQSVDET